MNIEKLPSGSYRVRKYSNGNSYQVVFDHKPTELEVIESLALKTRIEKIKPKKDMTIIECVQKYVSFKGDMMSPKTRKEYLALPRRLSEAFLGTFISEVDQDTIDAEIIRLRGRRLSKKTISNYMSQVKTAMKKYYPKLDINIDLVSEIKDKKKCVEEPYIPTKEEVRRLLDYVNRNDPMFYIPIALTAMCGMRRSEIIAMSPEDIDSDYNLHITTAVVEAENNDWVSKVTKNETSTRIVPIPFQLADRIKLQGYVYNGHPNSIGKALARVEKEIGLKEFSLHKLRHYYITELWDAGMSEADILYLSGHSKRSDINKIIYRHSRIKDDKERRAELANKLNSSFFN